MSRCRSVCSDSVWRRINDRPCCVRRVAKAETGYSAGAVAGDCRAGDAAVDRIGKFLGDADGGESRHGHDDLHHGFRPDAGVRPDGRAQFRSRRINRGRRLCRHPGAVAAGELGAGRLIAAQSCGAGAGSTVVDGGLRRAWTGRRARADPPRLWPAPQANPDDDGRTDRRRTSTVCVVGTADHSAAAADIVARLVHHRRYRDCEIPPAGDAGRPCRIRGHSTGAEPDQDRPVDPGRRGKPRDGGSAGLSHPPAVPRGVHGRLRSCRPRRRDVGAVSRAGARLDGQRSHGAGVHRGDHRRPRLDRRLLHRRAAGRHGCQLRRLSGAEAGAGFQHSPDGRDPDVAPSRAVCGDQSMKVLSSDPPRSRVLSIVLIVIIAALAVTPLLFPGAKAMNVATKICIFAALVASYDLLLGYTGSVSFAHTMFYGIGSYSIAIALYSMGPSWAAVATGVIVGLPLAMLLALGIGLFSLRVEAIFFAMITLAVASAFLVLASQLSWLTGGEDGRSFQLPELLRPDTVLISKDRFGFELNGRGLTYCVIFIASAAMILALLRVVNSPCGRVLQAIRENRFRAEALGFRTVFHLTYANCLAALVAASAGMLNALWLRYAGPDTSLSFSIMLDILLMVVIGGMGTIYGAISGATIFILAQNYLQALMGAASNAAADAGLPLLPGLLHPDRWLLWLGLLFIASVYFFPTGVVGRLRTPPRPSS